MIEKLVAIQTRDNLDDTEMGRRLGVGRSRWNALRNGKQELSHKNVLAAVGQWPELTRDLIDLAESTARSVTSVPRKDA